MNALARIAQLLLAPCLAATFASTAVAAGPTSAPFLATLTTTERIHFDASDCPMAPFLAGTTTGSGDATHLGPVTMSATDCIKPTSPFTFAFSNGKVTMISASGDELRAEYQGNLMPSQMLPIFNIVGSYRITGGTGRFNNASGSGAVLGLENLRTGQGQLTLKGIISY